MTLTIKSLSKSDNAYKTLSWLSIFIKMYMTEFFCLLDQIFILSYENRKEIRHPFFFAAFEAYESVKFHFRLGTIPHKTEE